MGETVWSEADWQHYASLLSERLLIARSEEARWRLLNRACRRVMRTYTTSFYLVSRFLPRQTREVVELIYAAVRYPDEVVDTFPLRPEECASRLDAWSAAYETGLCAQSLEEMTDLGTPPFLTGFCRVVQQYGIPQQHYRSFLQAMHRDIQPRPFTDLPDLIDSYVYGSAVVVGYFLTYAYGASAPSEFPRALAASRDLGIALQLTNFLRDVPEDQRRGRVYLPLDLLAEVGLSGGFDLRRTEEREAVRRAISRLAAIAEEHYAAATHNLDAFTPSCRPAIKACIDVYRRLNRRIVRSSDCLQRRQTVPALEKLRALPWSGIWRLPLAWL